MIGWFFALIRLMIIVPLLGILLVVSSLSFAGNAEVIIDKLKASPASKYDLGQLFLMVAFDRHLVPRLIEIIDGSYSLIVYDSRGRIELSIYVKLSEDTLIDPALDRYEACQKIVNETRSWLEVNELTGLPEDGKGSMIGAVLSRGMLSSAEEQQIDSLVTLSLTFGMRKGKLIFSCEAPLLRPYGEKIAIQEFE